MSLANRFASAAEELVGTRFRLHGRKPATGLDCVGLVACALELSGRKVSCPSGYALRNTAIDRYLAFAGINGFAPCTSPIARGDLLLARPGPGQSHLLVAISANCFVHAHAGLRRVVKHAGLPDWPLSAHWRLQSNCEE